MANLQHESGIEQEHKLNKENAKRPADPELYLGYLLAQADLVLTWSKLTTAQRRKKKEKIAGIREKLVFESVNTIPNPEVISTSSKTIESMM